MLHARVQYVSIVKCFTLITLAQANLDSLQRVSLE